MLPSLSKIQAGTIHNRQLRWGLLWSTGVKAHLFLRIKASAAGSDFFFFLLTRIAVPFIVGFVVLGCKT